MSDTNGAPSPPVSPSGSLSPAISQASQVLNDLRLSVDSDRSNTSTPAANGANGHIPHDDNNDGEDSDIVSRLQRDLQRTREEKEALASQYRNLLAKLTAMRNTLGNKLKQDAEELDRREQLVEQLTAQNEDLTATVETLKEELITSHEESEHASNELDSLRSRTFQDNAQETLLREKELRETQTELERCRMEKDEWERLALHERAMTDEFKSSIETLKRDMELESAARIRVVGELESEKEKAQNLQSVLEDFQAAKEHELRQGVKDYEVQLMQVTQSLAEFKSRALNAELKLEETHTNTSRTAELEKELKEKKLQIEKLRLEAVILNEHLMEALRRLRKNSTDTNVDRRLVTNVLLSFITTPRADGKRFEMLSLLATILSWSDAEREKAGLQQSYDAVSPSSSFWGRRSISSSNPGREDQLNKTDETESFSRLWVEFLLTEANSTGAHESSTASSQPNSPSHSKFPSLGSTTPTKGTRRLPSFSPIAMASSPNLSRPLNKGKERAMD